MESINLLVVLATLPAGEEPSCTHSMENWLHFRASACIRNRTLVHDQSLRRLSSNISNWNAHYVGFRAIKLTPPAGNQAAYLSSRSPLNCDTTTSETAKSGSNGNLVSLRFTSTDDVSASLALSVVWNSVVLRVHVCCYTS